jgi:Protein of unknown function (DUF2934)
MRKKSATLTSTGSGTAPAKKTATVSIEPSANGQLVAATVISVEPSANGQLVSEDHIRLLAYRKWQTAGKPTSDGVQFWLEAERELLRAK